MDLPCFHEDLPAAEGPPALEIQQCSMALLFSYTEANTCKASRSWSFFLSHCILKCICHLVLLDCEFSLFDSWVLLLFDDLDKYLKLVPLLLTSSQNSHFILWVYSFSIHQQMFIEWPMAVPLIDTTGQAVNKTEFGLKKHTSQWQKTDVKHVYQ